MGERWDRKNKGETTSLERNRLIANRFRHSYSGGTVLDGMGGEAVRADVGIVDDRIAAVGDLSRAQAGTVIAAEGLRVAPGFIDIHTHSDISATYDPGQASAIGMGVTTQVVGNCGLALGFANNSDAFAFEKRWLAPYRARITWNSFDEHLRLVEDRGLRHQLCARLPDTARCASA